MPEGLGLYGSTWGQIRISLGFGLRVSQQNIFAWTSQVAEQSCTTTFVLFKAIAPRTLGFLSPKVYIHIKGLNPKP